MEIEVENGKIIRFQHSVNGKTFLCEHCDAEMSEYIISNDLKDVLFGKTIEKQMEYFYVTESRRIYKTAYGEITKEDLKSSAVKLCEYYGVKKLLIKDSVLIGAKVDSYWGEAALLLDKPICTYYASDNEGSGTNDREDYAYLIFNKND